MALPSKADLALVTEISVLEALRRLADACTFQGCVHQHHDEDGNPTEDPAYCHCRTNLMTPGEFLDWIQDEARANGRQHVHVAGAPKRKGDTDPRLTLAIAV